MGRASAGAAGDELFGDLPDQLVGDDHGGHGPILGGDVPVRLLAGAAQQEGGDGSGDCGGELVEDVARPDERYRRAAVVEPQ